MLAGNSGTLKISGGRALASSVVATVLILLLAIAPFISSDVLPIKAAGKTNDAIKSAMHRKNLRWNKKCLQGEISHQWRV